MAKKYGAYAQKHITGALTHLKNPRLIALYFQKYSPGSALEAHYSAWTNTPFVAQPVIPHSPPSLHIGLTRKRGLNQRSPNNASQLTMASLSKTNVRCFWCRLQSKYFNMVLFLREHIEGLV
jgi:hypothetical protein